MHADVCWLLIYLNDVSFHFRRPPWLRFKLISMVFCMEEGSVLSGLFYGKLKCWLLVGMLISAIITSHTCWGNETPQALAAIYPSYLLHWHFYAPVRNDQSNILGMQKVKDAVILFLTAEFLGCLPWVRGEPQNTKVWFSWTYLSVYETYLPPFSLLLSQHNSVITDSTSNITTAVLVIF